MADPSRFSIAPPWRAPIIAGIAALLAGAFVLGLDFQIDDFWILPSAWDQLEATLRLPLDPALVFSGQGVELPAPDTPLFQPTLWALLALESMLSGSPLNPAVFHGVSLLLHAITTALLVSTLSKRIPGLHALLAGLLFSFHPASFQAVTWISARGSILVVLFGLMAWRRLQKTSSRSIPDALVSGVWLALALGSQVGALPLIPILAVALKSQPLVGQRRSFSLRLLGLLLPSLALLCLRRGYLGSWSFSYLAGTSFGVGSLVGALPLVPRFLARLAFPWNFSEEAAPVLAEGSAMSALAWLFAGTLGTAMLLAVVSCRRQVNWRQILAFGIVAAALLLPALLLFSMNPNEQDNRNGRALYPGIAALSATLVTLLCPAIQKEKARWLRWAGFVLCLISFAGLVFSAVQNAKLERIASQKIEARGLSLKELAEGAPPDGVLLAEDSEPIFAGIPLVTSKHLHAMLKPPFANGAVPVRGFPDLDSLVESGEISALPSTLRVVRWNGGGFEPLGAWLLPRSPRLPELVRAQTSNIPDSTRFEPRDVVGPRQIAGISIPLLQGADREVTVLIEAPPAAFILEARSPPDGRELIFGLDRRMDCLFNERLIAITVRGPIQGAPRLLAELPRLEVLQPSHEERHVLSGNPATIRFSAPSPPEAARIRLVARFGDAVFRTVYVIPKTRISPEGSNVFRVAPTAQDIVSATHPELHFEGSAQYFRDRLSAFGVLSLNVEMEAETLNSDLATHTARSLRRTIRFVLPE